MAGSGCTTVGKSIDALVGALDSYGCAFAGIRSPEPIKPGMTMMRGLVLVGEVAFYRERCQRPGDRPVSIGRPTSASDLADCFASVSATHVGA